MKDTLKTVDVSRKLADLIAKTITKFAPPLGKLLTERLEQDTIAQVMQFFVKSEGNWKTTLSQNQRGFDVQISTVSSAEGLVTTFEYQLTSERHQISVDANSSFQLPLSPNQKLAIVTTSAKNKDGSNGYFLVTREETANNGEIKYIDVRVPVFMEILADGTLVSITIAKNREKIEPLFVETAYISSDNLSMQRSRVSYISGEKQEESTISNREN